MYKVIDAPSDLSDFADDLVNQGVKTVIRYYNHKNSSRLPTKCLELPEAKALQQAGLSLAVVFEQRGGEGENIQDLDRSHGNSDAQRAMELAKKIGQPKGSAIYFAVDYDYYRNSEINQILPYFQEVKNGSSD